jgi:hypothetical protein
MVRFSRLPKTLVAAALAAAFTLALPAAAFADHRHGGHGFWLPFPPPPPFFFPRVAVHRHGPYCGHSGYGYYDRYERYGDRHERWERRRDRHERHERYR